MVDTIGGHNVIRGADILQFWEAWKIQTMHALSGVYITLLTNSMLYDLLIWNCFSDRKCLRYFLPPTWSMNKDEVNGLNLDELSAFPLESFFDHYEKGLRDVRKHVNVYLSCTFLTDWLTHSMWQQNQNGHVLFPKPFAAASIHLELNGFFEFYCCLIFLVQSNQYSM